MTMPAQKPHRSKQDYQTPPEFLAAVRAKFGALEFDLAASPENAACARFYTEADNSLVQTWPHSTGWAGGWNWLNPPFADIAPWVKKASQEGARTLVLIPASVGANWWRDWVHEKAVVYFLNGRIRFVGAKDLYPKDCALLQYGAYGDEPDYSIWTWPKDVPKPEGFGERILRRG